MSKKKSKRKIKKVKERDFSSHDFSSKFSSSGILKPYRKGYNDSCKNKIKRKDGLYFWLVTVILHFGWLIDCVKEKRI